MKRSQINTILADTEDFVREQGFALPPYADWDPDLFKNMVRNSGYEEIVRAGLGWMVTDFGLGAFAENGLVVFTTRMGDYRELESGRGKLYAEKILIQRDGQRTPFHYHRVKTEDVINRSEATLVLHLYHATKDGDLDENKRLQVNIDGQYREFLPGETISLRAGEGLTIEPGVYHDFSARGGDVLAVEISLANDDATDNIFYDPVSIAQDIEEDEQPRRLLVQDYSVLFPDLGGRR